jgi:hypothetical protein
VLAEQTAREIGHVDLREALELCALIATHDRERGMRAGTRWLGRWLDQADGPPVDEVAMVAAALAALGGSGHNSALTSLRCVALAAGSRGWGDVNIQAR